MRRPLKQSAALVASLVVLCALVADSLGVDLRVVGGALLMLALALAIASEWRRLKCYPLQDDASADAPRKWR